MVENFCGSDRKYEKFVGIGECVREFIGMRWYVCDEDPPPQRSQKIVQAHELESEAQILACDMEYEDQEAADEDHKARRWPSQLGRPCRMAHMCTWCINYAM